MQPLWRRVAIDLQLRAVRGQLRAWAHINDLNRIIGRTGTS